MMDEVKCTRFLTLVTNIANILPEDDIGEQSKKFNLAYQGIILLLSEHLDLLDEPATRLERLASEVTEANPDGHVFERLAALDIRLTNAARDLEVELMANSTNDPIEIMREAQRKLISLGVSCTLMFEDDYASLQVDVGVKNRSQESTESPWRD